MTLDIAWINNEINNTKAQLEEAIRTVERCNGAIQAFEHTRLKLLDTMEREKRSAEELPPEKPPMIQAVEKIINDARRVAAEKNGDGDIGVVSGNLHQLDVPEMIDRNLVTGTEELT